jgi:hypothetical protein
MASGPGRIDIIDGQYRFAVVDSLVVEGTAQVRDYELPPTAVGPDGKRYAFYGPAASFVGLPLALCGYGSRDRAQMFFSFASAIVAAVGLAVLFLLYELLGVPRRRALGWTAATGFATLLWPLATSTFDQAQQATCVVVAAWAGVKSAREKSNGFALLAGAACGVLVLYQEMYAVLAAPFALFLAVEGESLADLLRSRRLRAFAASFSLGLLALAGWNLWRFGSALMTGKTVVHHPLVGNPLVGAAVLLISPGKSIFLFSPPIVLAIVGWRHFRARWPAISRASLATLGLHFAMISCLAFSAGDWSWGPRYLVVTLPLTALAMPFARLGRAATGTILALGVVVQLMALSVDHQRWFVERALDDYFWVDRSIYFRESQLLSRPSEMATLGKIPGEATRFRPGPYQTLLTYAPFGTPRAIRWMSPLWMRHFSMFWRPRPWPLWMTHVKSPPVRPMVLLGALFLLAIAGGTLISYGEKRNA